MKTAQPELVVDLDRKLTQLLAHWEAVDRELPASYPLVLLRGLNCEASQSLAVGLSELLQRVQEREVGLAVAWGNYKVLKAELHGQLRLFNCWMRGHYQWTTWFVAVRRVPGRGQSYEHWSGAALVALTLWQWIVEAPPDPSVDPLCRPLTFGDDTTVEQFGELVRAFDAAYWKIIKAEVKLQIARGHLKLAQAEATALLMAYGHGVRARFGEKDELVRSIPELWPKHKRKGKADRAEAA